jgi:hypothetical protein
MIKLFTSFALALLLISCSSKAKQRGMIYFNDYENIKGWNDYILKKPTYSGLYSNCMDSTHSYGSTFKLPFREVSMKPIKKIKIDFWVYYSSMECKAKYALDIKDMDKNPIFWISNDIDKQVTKEKTWTHVAFVFTLVKKDINLPNYVVSLYPWNQTKKEIYVDDVTIEFVQ